MKRTETPQKRLNRLMPPDVCGSQFQSRERRKLDDGAGKRRPSYAAAWCGFWCDSLHLRVTTHCYGVFVEPLLMPIFIGLKALWVQP
jgi:hypothetical protein